MPIPDEIWELALDATAKNDLRQFTKTAEDLSKHWRRILDEHYPFQRSFEEIVCELRQWNEHVQKINVHQP